MRKKEDYRYDSVSSWKPQCGASQTELKYCTYFSGNRKSRSIWACENMGLSGNCKVDKPIAGGE